MTSIVPYGWLRRKKDSRLTINVNVTPGTDLVEIGRQVVEAIRAHEKRSGQGGRQ